MEQMNKDFETLLEAMTQANPQHDKDFSLSVIAVMFDFEKHSLQKIQDSVLSAGQVQMLERGIKEGFYAPEDAESLAHHYEATGKAFMVIADVAKRLADGRV